MPLVEAGHYRVGEEFTTPLAEHFKPKEAVILLATHGIPAEVTIGRGGETLVKFKKFKGRR